MIKIQRLWRSCLFGIKRRHSYISYINSSAPSYHTGLQSRLPAFALPKAPVWHDCSSDMPSSLIIQDEVIVPLNLEKRASLEDKKAIEGTNEPGQKPSWPHLRLTMNSNEDQFPT